MKLFIHDKCFEKILELPKATSKKVIEFQKKFRENSRTDAINLESIVNFKDKSLRTARIDLKYRAIIRVPDSGENYYLLWVDNHDEAMNWAKNKVFKWNELTQTAQIFTSPDSIENLESYTPTEAGIFDKFTDLDLMKIGVPDSLLITVKNIKNLNDLEKLESHLPTDAFENLFYLSDGILIDTIISDTKSGIVQGADFELQQSSINNMRSFIEVDDKMMEEVVNGDIQKWQIFLHPTQRKLVEGRFSGSVKVTGGAGTGKTVVALHRLKYLVHELKKHSENKKIIFTTFTKALTSNLNLLAKKLHIEEGNFQIESIDSLLRSLAISNGIITRSTKFLDMYNTKKSYDIWNEVLEINFNSIFDADFLQSEYENVILYNNIETLNEYANISRFGRVKSITRKQKKEIWELVEKYNELKKNQNYIDRLELYNRVTNFFNSQSDKPFWAVIADEIQDLSNIELRFLRSLVTPKENDMFLVGDPYQKIYAKRINFKKAGILVVGGKSKQLKINYRTTEQIKRLAVTTVQNLNYDDFDGSNESLKGYRSLLNGEKPTYEIFRSKSDEIKSIILKIQGLLQNGYYLSDIAIGSRTNDSLMEIKNALEANMISYKDNISHDSITTSTFHGLKGLEFKVVFLFDVNSRTCPLIFSSLAYMDLKEKEQYLNNERSLMYVAMTRAISKLFISGTGTKSELINV